jgi:hypothetical protein
MTDSEPKRAFRIINLMTALYNICYLLSGNCRRTIEIRTLLFGGSGTCGLEIR